MGRGESVREGRKRKGREGREMGQRDRLVQRPRVPSYATEHKLMLSSVYAEPRACFAAITSNCSSLLRLSVVKNATPSEHQIASVSFSKGKADG